MTCDTCNVDKKVTLEHGVKWGKAWIRWRICVECELRDRQLQGERAAAAVEQAERGGA